ncbi:MAG: ribosome maturation factor RimM [Defluviitaleaceae bacterium]|nr:ribosome maturation factor RimM [Defluviitaleaceae bacterium]MCL2835460.1 ribosome maturation factor RimM [Defluviitaleaceae bacterium]
MNAYFEVGAVTGAFGLKGEVKVFPTTDEPERFRLLRELYADSDAGPMCYAIERLRFHKNLVIIKFTGVEDAAAAQALRGTVLKIPPELALPLEEGQYYHRDLLDMSVVDDDGRELGVLTKVLQTGANDVYTVALSEGGELLIPAIKQCILKVNVPDKRMTVKLLPGLM